MHVLVDSPIVDSLILFIFMSYTLMTYIVKRKHFPIFCELHEATYKCSIRMRNTALTIRPFRKNESTLGGCNSPR